ncbi:hypothetical protein TeGR_g7914 [Tetraparma gracilis]|uniref:Uncharacterized protein n=1 Tax=Tetraparma gracilis TaxID=2962635 RepID=A0ABQ6MXI4_9STRA|nr:hypothetical protein TeGR_g7914 [Tetraparma gracilis]
MPASTRARAPLQSETYPFWPRLRSSPTRVGRGGGRSARASPRPTPEVGRGRPRGGGTRGVGPRGLRRFPAAEDRGRPTAARGWIDDASWCRSRCARTRAAVRERDQGSPSPAPAAPAELAFDVAGEARRLLSTPGVPTALVAAPAWGDPGEFLDAVYALDDGGDRRPRSWTGAVLLVAVPPGRSPSCARRTWKRRGGEEATGRIAEANEGALLGRRAGEVEDMFRRLAR